MSRFFTTGLAALTVLMTASTVLAHCQVPCGVYGDQRRFETMLEDTQTIEKGIGQINELAGGHDGLSANQLTRWVNTKEDHASNIQKIMAEYFLTQRIKSDNEAYADQLATAHAVMVAAMKCKQTVDPESATALKTAILAFYKAYEGKEPHFE